MIRATVSDLPRMETAAREFYASTGFQKCFDMGRFCAFWTNLFQEDIGVIFALDDGDEIPGALGGVVFPDPYSETLISTGFFWYVSKEARGRGIELYRAFEAWAVERGCSQIRMAHLFDLMPEKMARTYHRLGFVPMEVHYIKELR